ncbi:30S ribosomal protein S20 [Candidatus Mesenet endosymbiont of Phosphuga atrata]|uniref:30S ribosomal protein S20 n=1 Tax=Candidatus Mesenet endosymbiont of Phosphuga atrata TaxID=3066221 RepID=UPI0030D3BB31
MANTASAKKMIRKIEKRTLINNMRKNKTRTTVRKVMDAISAGSYESAMLAFKSAMSNLHRCVTKGVMHKNTAARKISRLNAKIHKLFKSTNSQVNLVEKS